MTRLSPTSARVFDANLNRAREALRLCEDWSRFVLDDAALCADLKILRHDLAGATKFHAEQSMTSRDTRADVGTAISTPAEQRRSDLGAAVTAAGKRFGEAARVIEEVLKTVDPTSAAVVEQVRYRFYTIEQRLAATIRPETKLRDVRIYVILTEAVCKADWLATAEACLAGGAEAIQLREPDMDAAELLRRAKILAELCKVGGALSIINDRPDIALLSGADGVHVGQTDLPPEEARRIVGRDKFVGVSTHNLEQIKAARLAGADYVGVGPVFPSTTKPRNIDPGLSFAKAAAELNALPTFAIGGITAGNAPSVWQTAITGLAVASAVTMSDDPAAAVKALR